MLVQEAHVRRTDTSNANLLVSLRKPRCRVLTPALDTLVGRVLDRMLDETLQQLLALPESEPLPPLETLTITAHLLGAYSDSESAARVARSARCLILPATASTPRQPRARRFARRPLPAGRL